MGLTNNYKEYRRVTSEYHPYIDQNEYRAATAALKDTNGDLCNFLYYDFSRAGSYVLSNYCFNDNLSVKVGSGNTTESAEDYELETILGSGSNLTRSYSLENGKFRIRITFKYTNFSASDVIVSEIGLYKDIYYMAGTSIKPFLMARHVLDEPITVTVGSSALFTFDIVEE